MIDILDQHLLVSICAFAISLLCGLAFIPMILKFCKDHNLYDIPNERKMHKNKIPRLGGICFLPSMSIAIIISIIMAGDAGINEKVTVSLWTICFVISLLLIYVIGLIDDVVGVSAIVKFIVQIIAASLLPLSYLYINDLHGLFGIHALPVWIGSVFTVLLMVFIVNAINLIDGIDGLSGLLSLFSLMGFFYIFYNECMWIYSMLISGLMGVIVAFLRYNLFGNAKINRKIFMGDSGALTIGFILAFLLVKSSMTSELPHPIHPAENFMVAYTLLLVPCFDVIAVICIRLKNKTGIFTPDKNHIHHHLMAMGLSAHQSLAVIILMAVFFVLLNAVLSRCGCSHTVIVVFDVVVYFIVRYCIACKRNA